MTTTNISVTPQQSAESPVRLRVRSLAAVYRVLFQNDIARIIGVAALFLWLPLRNNIWVYVVETDWWWHLRTGEWIFQNHRVPRTDPFSITGAGKPWVAYSWPFDMVLYQVAKHWDLLGVVAFTVGIWVAMVLAFLYLLRSFRPPFWVSLGLALIGGMSFQIVMSPRPGGLTVIAFILVLEVLCTARRKLSVRRLWLIPVIMWLWASVHVQFVYGLFLIGVFCLEPVFDRLLEFAGVMAPPGGSYLPARWMWGTLAASVIATVLNPYGWGSYQVLYDFAKQPLLAGFVTETLPMAFDQRLHFIVLLVCLAGVFALARQSSVRPVWVILMVWSALSSFRFQRDIWLVTVISSVLIVQAITNSRHEPVKVNQRVWLGAIPLILLGLVLTFQRGPTNRDLSSLVAGRLPLGEVAYIHEHHLQGPLFNHYDWGGFLIYALPEMPVSIDGRTNVHGQEEVGRSLHTWSFLGDDLTDPLLRSANLIIAPRYKPLTFGLSQDRHFRAVFEDQTGILFQRILAPDPLPATKEASAQ